MIGEFYTGYSGSAFSDEIKALEAKGVNYTIQRVPFLGFFPVATPPTKKELSDKLGDKN